MRSLLVLFLLALRLPAVAQAPAWQSARAVAAATAAVTGVTGNYSNVTGTAVDAAGNVYLTGSFTNSVVLGGTTLTSLGSTDIFVAKFNPVINQFVWAQRAGSTDGDSPSALAVSGNSVYITGNFISSTLSFGATTLTNVGSADVFIAKLTDAGSFVWAQRAGGAGSDNVQALAVSGTSVYLTGVFIGSTINFGSITLAGMGLYDVFVAKLTDIGNTGSFVWAQRAGGVGNDIGLALTVSGTSVYMAGSFASSPATFGTATLTTTGSTDVFVTKLTDAGSFVWAQKAGGTGSDFAYALAVSGTGVYVAGKFASSTANFGTATLASTGSDDAFVAKLIDAGSTGSFLWAQRAGGTNTDYANALAVSGTSVYVVGSFASPTAGFGGTTLINEGSDDAFVAKLTDAGSFVWVQQAGGTGSDVGYTLVVDGASVYVTGGFSSPIARFGTIAITDPNRSPNSYTGFLASLTDATLTATTAATGPREPATLFPNPARRTATLRLPAGTTPAPLVLTDALGRAVRRYPAPAGAEATLDLNGLPAGLYLLRGAGPAQRLVVE